MLKIQNMSDNIYLASKPRYEILDGLRGVAALMVIVYHCFETYIPQIGTQVINHGYLAVDFFFVLSGFVIGYAYDDRWNKMSTWGFFKRRLVRLHPMVVAGTVIGAALFFLGDCEEFPLVSKCPAWMFTLCFVMGIFMIPTGPGLDIRGWGETNSFNGPNWSLTYEYVGNVLYAFIFRRLPKAALAALCAVSAFFTLDLTLGWDVFGLFAEAKYDVIGGWSLTADQIYVGFARLLFPFLCGLLISRILPSHRSENNPSGSPIHLRGGFWWASLILVTVFSVPQICGKSCLADGIYQSAAIIAIFPFVVLLGAGSTTSDVLSTKVCKFLGELSYPLYITHFPLIYAQKAWVGSHHDALLWQHVAINAGIIVFAVILAWCVYKTYDLPVRKWLTDKVLKKNRAAAVLAGQRSMQPDKE